MNFTRDQLEKWLLAYADGDLSSFEALYDATYRLVFAALRRRVDSADAHDLLQETYLRVHRHVRSYKKDGNSLSWLLTIAHNVATDHQKRSRKMLLVYDVPEQAAGQIDSEAADADFETLISGLSAEDQRLVRDRFEYGFSYAQIAKSHKAEESTIRQRLSRVIRKMRLKTTR